MERKKKKLRYKFILRILVWNSGNERVELPVGQSEYYFSFQLPRNIPCSFEHEVGYIRYTAKAIVDRPWKFDWWTKSAFTVVAPFDLNPISHQCVSYPFPFLFFFPFFL